MCKNVYLKKKPLKLGLNQIYKAKVIHFLVRERIVHQINYQTPAPSAELKIMPCIQVLDLSSHTMLTLKM